MAEKFSPEYRKGFLNGYERAFEDLMNLLERDDYNLAEAKAAGRAFWTDDLSDWLENGGALPTLYIPEATDKPVTTTVEPDSTAEEPHADKTP